MGAAPEQHALAPNPEIRYVARSMVEVNPDNAARQQRLIAADGREGVVSVTASVLDCAVRGNRQSPRSGFLPRGRIARKGTDALQPAAVLFPLRHNATGHR